MLKSKDSTLDDAGIKEKLLSSVYPKANLSSKASLGSRLNAAPARAPVSPPSYAPAPALTPAPATEKKDKMKGKKGDKRRRG